MKSIPIISIDASNRLRPVDELNAQAIAASIEEHGLIQPIVVRPDGDGYRLTAGGHRLAAMRLLGWQDLKVGEHVIIRAEETDDDALTSEIFENIFRGELSALDRMIALTEAQRIFNTKRGETRGRPRKDVENKEDKIIDKMSIISSPRFTEDAAARVGLTERQIQRDLAILKNLPPAAIKALRGTMVEGNQNELQLLAKFVNEPTNQIKAAKAIKAGEAKTVQQAMVVIGAAKEPSDDPQLKIFDTLIINWRKAGAATRRKFMDHLEKERAAKGAKA